MSASRLGNFFAMDSRLGHVGSGVEDGSITLLYYYIVRSIRFRGSDVIT